MPFIALSILVQIACAVHCVRGGRNQMWLMVIIFLSIPGCFAYFIFEILPGLAGRREVRAVKSAAVKVIDPARDVRLARDALDVADTAANRLALADAHAGMGHWSDAIAQYDLAESKAPGIDRSIRVKLATACFSAGQSARAREIIEALPPSGSISENDRISLLHACLLAQDGETERALEIYSDIGTRMIGGEAQCRHAALLMTLGREHEALPLLVEIEKRVKRIDRHERARNSDMYEWAADSLAELRAKERVRP